MKKEDKEVIKGLSGFLLYMVIGELVLYIVLALLGIKASKLSPQGKLISNIILETGLIITIIAINKNTVKKHFIDFKKNYKDYITKYFKYWIFFFLAMMISNMMIYHITNIKTATNQEQVLDSLNKYPIYTTILSILLAPLLEELVFRLSIRKMIKNDTLFIVLSGLSFGLLHLTSATSLPELLYIIPYAIPGFVLAITLIKSKNIFVPISLHLFHNTILLLVQFILMII